MPQKRDHKGERFGRLLVEEEGPRRGRAITWLCLCDCGNRTRVVAQNLRDGKTSSCGCLRKEMDWNDPNNRRTSRWVTWRGVTMTVTQWERAIGTGKNVISRRLHSNWSTRRIFTEGIDQDVMDEIVRTHRSL